MMISSKIDNEKFVLTIDGKDGEDIKLTMDKKSAIDIRDKLTILLERSDNSDYEATPKCSICGLSQLASKSYHNRKMKYCPGCGRKIEHLS
jgi:hypothetical protein